MPPSPRALVACLAFTSGAGALAWIYATLAWVVRLPESTGRTEEIGISTALVGIAVGVTLARRAHRPPSSAKSVARALAGFVAACAGLNVLLPHAGSAAPLLIGLAGVGLGASAEPLRAPALTLFGGAAGVAFAGALMMFGIDLGTVGWLATAILATAAVLTWFARDHRLPEAESEGSPTSVATAVLGVTALVVFLLVAHRALAPYTGDSVYARAVFGVVLFAGTALGTALAARTAVISVLLGALALCAAAGLVALHGELEWVLAGAVRRLGGIATWPRALVLVLTETTLFVLPVAALLSAAIGRAALREPRPVLVSAAATIVLAAPIAAALSAVALGHHPFEARYGPLLDVEETGARAILVTDDPEQGRMLRRSDGHLLGGVGTDAEDRANAQIPMLVHPGPKRVLQLGFGVGNGASSILAHPVERLDVVEANGSPDRTASFFDFSNLDVLSDDRLVLHANPPFWFLSDAPNTWDVIRLRAEYLETAGGEELPTVERLQLVQSKLAPGGVVSLRANLGRMSDQALRSVLATMLAVFPHVTVWDGPLGYNWVINGSMVERAPDPGRLEALREDPDVDAEIGSLSLDEPETFLGHFVMETTQARAFAGAAPPVRTTDAALASHAARSPLTFFGLGGAVADSKLADLSDTEITENVGVARLFGRLQEAKRLKQSAAAQGAPAQLPE